MNIVQVNFIGTGGQKRYTFKVPTGIVLHNTDVVLVRSRDGSEGLAQCVTDSVDVSEAIVDMVMNGQRILSSVSGKYTLERFEEPINEDDAEQHIETDGNILAF